MRKIITILGILLTATILLISGPALGASWHYAQDVVDYENCNDPEYALYAPDDEYASLASVTPVLQPGWIILDLGVGNGMGAEQTFTVFADSSVTETYDVYVGETRAFNDFVYIGPGQDDKDCNFTTPEYIDEEGWRYIYIEADYCTSNLDPSAGPDIDAVGFYGPP